MRYFFFVLCAGLMLLPPATFGRAYYVARLDTLNADGSLAHPFPHIQQAAALMAAGDTCYIRQGVYRETVRPANSGSSGRPMVFARYQNEAVTVHGGDVVAGAWGLHSGSIYKTAYSGTVRDLFVNRRYMLQARHPNMPYDSARGGFTMLMTRTGTANPPANVDWNGVIMVRRSSMNEILVQNAYANDIYGILIGPLGLLDAEGEWAYIGGTLYLWPPGGTSPDSRLIETRVRDFGFNLQQRNYCIVKGIEFFATSLNLDQATNCIIDSCRVLYPTPLFMNTGYTNGWNRENGSSANVNGKGVVLGGSANIVRNCEVAHSWGDGITMYGAGNTIDNCHVYDCDWSGTDCAPICTGGSGHFIRNNTAHDGGRSVLLHRRTGNLIIEHNDLFGAGWIQYDLGVTYAFNTDGRGSEIRYNWVHECYLQGAGIYLDNYTSNFVVHHNAIWSAQAAYRFWGLGFNAPQTNNRFYNNALDNTISQITVGDSAWTNCNFTNNILQRTLVNMSPSLVVNQNNYEDSLAPPRFADPDNGDLRLTPASPCIDKGKVLAPYTDGYAGSAPDQGAYESGATAWIAGSSLAYKIWQAPKVPNQLSRRGWRQYVSTNSAWSACAMDGRLDTRWETYTPYAASGLRYFLVNLQKALTFNRIVLYSTASPDQTIKAYEVYVSNTGLDYGMPVASGTGSGGICTINLPMQTAQYVKLVSPAGAANTRWAIEEFFLAYDSAAAANAQPRLQRPDAMPQVTRIYAPDGSLIARCMRGARPLAATLRPGLYVMRMESSDGAGTCRTIVVGRGMTVANAMALARKLRSSD
jgi:hypothetical protein